MITSGTRRIGGADDIHFNSGPYYSKMIVIRLIR